MTVKELIEKLSRFDENMEVRIAQPTHCYWRRTVAHDINRIDHGLIEYSEYYEDHVIIDSDEEDSADREESLDDEKQKEVLVLR